MCSKVRTILHIKMSWFKENTEWRKTSFLKKTAENTDLNKAVLKKQWPDKNSA